MNLPSRLADRAENSIMQTLSIAVSAILIAAGLVTAPGLIVAARDSLAQTDLANAAYAEESAISGSGAALYYDNATFTARGLENPGSSGVSFRPSAGVRTVVDVSDDGRSWSAAARADGSPTVWIRTSASATTTTGSYDSIGAAGVDVMAGAATVAAIPRPAGIPALQLAAQVRALGGLSSDGSCAQGSYFVDHSDWSTLRNAVAGVNYTRSAATVSSIAGITAAKPASYTIASSYTCNGVTAPSAVPAAIGAAALPNATYGQRYDATVSVSGSPTPTVSLSGLPAGLTASGAAIGGTPTEAGVFNIGVTASGYGPPQTSTVVLTVAGVAPTISTAALPPGVYGQPYDFTPAATGPGATSWSVSALPAGLRSDDASTGRIYGTPTDTSAGTPRVTLGASNAYGGTSVSLPLVVAGIAPGAITPASVTNPVQNAAGYSAQFAASGYPAPTFTRVSGALPAGMQLSAAGVLSGTPTTLGAATFTVQASNGVGTPTTQSVTLTVVPAAPTAAPSIARFSNEGGNHASAYDYMWANTVSCAAGATPQYRFEDTSSGGTRGSGFWQTWNNFEIGTPAAPNTLNSWRVSARCTDSSAANTDAGRSFSYPGSSTTVSATRAFASQPYTTELLANPSFEGSGAGSTSSWGAGTGGISVSSVGGSTGNGGAGSYAALVNNTSNGSFAQNVSMTPANGRTYTASIWVKAQSGTSAINLCLWALNPVYNNQQNNCSGGTTVTSDAWTQVSVPLTITRSDHNQLKLEAYLGSGSFYFDEATLRIN